MSLFIIRPSVPVPLTNFKLIPLSSASFFAKGDALTSTSLFSSAEGKFLVVINVLKAGLATGIDG